MQAFLKDLGARFESRAAETWKEISKVLSKEYNGDPRNLTKQPSTVEEIKEKLEKFRGLRGPKLSNFYIRVMAEYELFKIKDLDKLDVAVDIQVARFTIYTGVLKLASGEFRGCPTSPPLRTEIQKAWREAAQIMPPWKLDERMWAIGSKLCTDKKCEECPIGKEELCDKAWNHVEELRSEELIWNPTGKSST